MQVRRIFELEAEGKSLNGGLEGLRLTGQEVAEGNHDSSCCVKLVCFVCFFSSASFRQSMEVSIHHYAMPRATSLLWAATRRFCQAKVPCQLLDHSSCNVVTSSCQCQQCVVSKSDSKQLAEIAQTCQSKRNASLLPNSVGRLSSIVLRSWTPRPCTGPLKMFEVSPCAYYAYLATVFFQWFLAWLGFDKPGSLAKGLVDAKTVFTSKYLFFRQATARPVEKNEECSPRF